jgi:nucleoredoxin
MNYAVTHLLIIYKLFSQQCPPCRSFTPQLDHFYTQLKGEDLNAMEIVFISSDDDENSFNSYYNSMPWVALPFAKIDVNKRLATKYGVRGIPTLVILNGNTGDVIDLQGRTTVFQADGCNCLCFARPPVSAMQIASNKWGVVKGETANDISDRG